MCVILWQSLITMYDIRYRMVIRKLTLLLFRIRCSYQLVYLNLDLSLDYPRVYAAAVMHYGCTLETCIYPNFDRPFTVSNNTICVRMFAPSVLYVCFDFVSRLFLLRLICVPLYLHWLNVAPRLGMDSEVCLSVCHIHIGTIMNRQHNANQHKHTC